MNPQTPDYSTPLRQSQCSDLSDINTSLSELSVSRQSHWESTRRHPSSPTPWARDLQRDEDDEDEDIAQGNENDEDEDVAQGDENNEEEEAALEGATQLDLDEIHCIMPENLTEWHGTISWSEDKERLEAGPSRYLHRRVLQGSQSTFFSALIETAVQPPQVRPAVSANEPVEDDPDEDVHSGDNSSGVANPQPVASTSDSPETSIPVYKVFSADNPFAVEDSDDDVVDKKEFDEDKLDQYGFESDDDVDAPWDDAYTDNDEPFVDEPATTTIDEATSAITVSNSLDHNLRAFSKDEMVRICKEVFGVEPKPEQLMVAEHVCQGKDCILIAGCGWGKTLAYFLPLALWEDRTILVISPLKALMQDQREKLEKVHIQCTTLSSNENVPKDIVSQLAKGQYRAVFLTPEFIFKSKRLNELWHLEGWRRRLMAVVVDEAHCIESWGGKFRTSYGDLGRLRSRVRPGVPFIALSATLPDDTLTKIKKSLHYKRDTVIHAGTDRPNIFYEVRHLKHYCWKALEFKDLEFLLQDFKKTIVYFDDIKTLDHAHKYLCSKVPLAHRPLIQTFHSTNSSRQLKEALPLLRENSIRVLLATEAAGMGCDISDIERVVQYLAPDNLIVLVQRLGRAARDPAMQGEGILLVHNPIGRYKEQAKDNDLNEFIKAKGCLRKILNMKFGDKYSPPDPSACCISCSTKAQKEIPTFTFIAEDFSTTATIFKPTAEQKQDVWQKILQWRTSAFQKLDSEALFFVDEHHVLPDPTVIKLKDNFGKISSVEDIHSLVQWDPLDDSWPNEVLELLMHMRSTFEETLPADIQGTSNKQKRSKRIPITQTIQQCYSVIMYERPKKKPRRSEKNTVSHE